MKKIRIVLNVMAFVFAIGTAFASATTSLVQGYSKISGICQPSVQCNNQGATCKDAAGRDVFDGSSMNATSCGNLLRHQPI